MMTGTGMTANGDVLSPFGSRLLQLNELEDLEARFRLLLVALVIGSLYSALLLVVLQFTLSDVLIMLGTIFIGYRAVKINEEIYEIKQYLHGEGVLALE